MELAVIISKKAYRVKQDDFENYIAGYTVFNDITAREKQRDFKKAGQPWFLSKNMDTFAPMGPCMVTPKELSFPFDLDLELTINGEIKQKSNTGQMIVKIPQLIQSITP